MRGSTAPGPSANEPTSTHLLVPLPPVCTRAWARARSLRRAAQDARKSQQRFRSAAPKSIVQDECASAPSRAATPVHEALARSTRYTDFYAHAGMHWAVGRDTVDIVLLKQLRCRDRWFITIFFVIAQFWRQRCFPARGAKRRDGGAH